jgi:hypothetical protein
MMGDFLGPEMRAVIRKTADKTRAHAKLPLPKGNELDIVWGVVQGVFAGPPKYVTLQLMGDTTGTGTVTAKCSGSYKPQFGDYVFCVHHGKDLIVIDSLGGTVAGIELAVSYGFFGPAPTGNWPGPYIPSPLGQVVKVIAAIGDVTAGAITLDVMDGGSTIPGLTGIVLGSGASSTTCTPYTLPNSHKLHANASSVTGSGNVSFSIYTVTIG